MNAHNIESEIWRRNWEVARDPLKKMFFKLQWQRMLKFEKECNAAVLSDYSSVRAGYDNNDPMGEF